MICINLDTQSVLMHHSVVKVKKIVGLKLSFKVQYSPTTTSHWHALSRVYTHGYMERAAVCHVM